MSTGSGSRNLGASECQQLGREQPGAFGGLHDLVEIAGHVVRGGQAETGDVRRADDHGQCVVEVVRDAARHARQRLEPPCLLERMLRVLALFPFVGVLPLGALEREPLFVLAIGELAVHLHLVRQLFHDVELEHRNHEAEEDQDDGVAQPDGRHARIPQFGRDRRHEPERHRGPRQQVQPDDGRECDGGAAPPEEQRRGEHGDHLDHRVASGEAAARGEQERAEGEERQEGHRGAGEPQPGR